MSARTETKKRKSPAKPKLHVGLLIDESGSMAPLHGSVIAGVNEFVSELKADDPIAARRSASAPRSRSSTRAGSRTRSASASAT